MKNQQSEKSVLQAENDTGPSKSEADKDTKTAAPVEIGGPKGPEPTRYGDWEKAGRCSDF